MLKLTDFISVSTLAPLPPLEEVVKTDTSALTEAPEGYWTRKPCTYLQREGVANKFYKEFTKAMKDKGLACGFQFCRNFRRESNGLYTDIVACSLDSHAYGRAKMSDILDAVLTHFQVQHSSKHRVTTHCTSFMYEGVEIKMYHLRELNKGYVDSNMTHFMYGYNDIKTLFDILLAKYGFVQDDALNTKFVTASDGEEYQVGSGETFARLLGIGPKAFPNIVYYGRYSNVGELVTALLESKSLDISNFYLTPEKEYVGPADYFGSETFKEAVEFLRKPNVNFDTCSMLPETIQKHQLKYFEMCNLNSYRTLLKKLKLSAAKTILETKYNNSIIQEVTGFEAGDTRINMFKAAFEERLSQKEDLEFFLMSSSEETIKQRLVQYHQSLAT